MTDRDQPIFPFRVVWKESGEIELYEDSNDLLCSLEDFDSDDPDWDEAAVTDALGRPVHLFVRIYRDKCEFRLA